MESHKTPKYKILISNTGFSLIEVLAVITVMAIISAFSVPTFIEWQLNMTYKQSATEIANSLKTAQSKSITTNRQHGLQFVPADRSYQFCRYSTNQWLYYGSKNLLSNRIALNLNGTAASAVPPVPNIRFSYNGTTFDNYSIRIRSTENAGKYNVSVERSGRIKIIKMQ